MTQVQEDGFRLIPYNDEVYIGDKLVVEIPVVDPEDDSPLPITGASVPVNFASMPGGSGLLALSVGSGVTITDGPGGTFEFMVTPIQLAAIGIGVVYWEAIISLGGDIRTVAVGYIKIRPNVV